MVASHGSWGTLCADPNYKPGAKVEYKPKPEPKKAGTKRKNNDSNTEGTTAKRTKGASKSESEAGFNSQAGKDTNGLTDVSSISLEGEEDEDVPVYPTAVDIRKQLSTLLQTPGVTQARLCRSLSDVSGDSITVHQLRAFRDEGKKGGASVHGADSPAFYAASLYTEKLRILQGGKKSGHRLDMEDAWGDSGMSRKGLKSLCLIGNHTVTYDNLGLMLINGTISPANFMDFY